MKSNIQERTLCLCNMRNLTKLRKRVVLTKIVGNENIFIENVWYKLSERDVLKKGLGCRMDNLFVAFASRPINKSE